jgi:hypothetical protein
MHGNWRLFGTTMKKISLASWPDPDRLMAEANNQSRTPEAGARAVNQTRDEVTRRFVQDPHR